MQNMCTLLAVRTSPFLYEPPSFRMQNMAEYDTKYAEYEPPPKISQKIKKIKKSKICHLKPGITPIPTPGLRIIFSVINMQNMQIMYMQNMWNMQYM
jgi:hypothetical protein